MKHAFPANPKVQAMLDYISAGWDVLTRSSEDCQVVADPKLTEATVLYLPADYHATEALERISRECNIRIAHLPAIIGQPGEIAWHAIQPEGLLFLENPYVVPGGRFNEMYGWDSYFIIRGLLRHGRLALAHNMVENFFFEIERYGSVLNANRTYYLTRSQPPFLSSMVLAVHEAMAAAGQNDHRWLTRASQYVNRDYDMWVRPPHLAGPTGLSRYCDLGEGPVHEGLHDEIDYYHDVLSYFLRTDPNSHFLVKSETRESLPNRKYSRPLSSLDSSIGEIPGSSGGAMHVALSPEFYKGDRSMRESGFDISFRFGPFGAETHHFAPVCLNSLLYKTEKDMEEMSLLLGDTPAAARWHQCADKRKALIQSRLWNPLQGLFFDYDFEKAQLSDYEYATTFYPLWTGLATPEQAQAVVKNLAAFEQLGGLATSTLETGVQWDYPYGWAPLHLLAVEGLRRYGYHHEADRISLKFLSMVLANFERDGNLREKYNVVTDSSDIRVVEGYRGNIIGFGWTNGVFPELWNQLPAVVQRSLGQPLVV